MSDRVDEPIDDLVGDDEAGPEVLRENRVMEEAKRQAKKEDKTITEIFEEGVPEKMHALQSGEKTGSTEINIGRPWFKSNHDFQGEYDRDPRGYMMQREDLVTRIKAAAARIDPRDAYVRPDTFRIPETPAPPPSTLRFAVAPSQFRMSAPAFVPKAEKDKIAAAAAKAEEDAKARQEAEEKAEKDMTQRADAAMAAPAPAKTDEDRIAGSDQIFVAPSDLGEIITKGFRGRATRR